MLSPLRAGGDGSPKLAKHAGDIFLVPDLGKRAVSQRKISWPAMVTGRPVGGSPNRSKMPVLVPVMVQRPVTNCPSLNTMSAVNRASGRRRQPWPAPSRVPRPQAAGPGAAFAPDLGEPSPVESSLAAWLAEPGTGMLPECEALVKIAYADQGTRDGLPANLTALIDDTTAKLHFGEMIARQYLDGLGRSRSGCAQRPDVAVSLGVPADLARRPVQLDAIAEFTRIVAAAGSPLDNSWEHGNRRRRLTSPGEHRQGGSPDEAD